MNSSETIRKDVPHNFFVNVADAGMFGFSFGFASTVTIIPLFIATLTDSKAIIGLIATLNVLGWHLPQLFTADRVAHLKRYKPMVALMTLNERIPFFLLAIVAFAIPVIGKELALFFAFLLLTWQGIGGGLTATAWQSMIAKVIPNKLRGRFYGTQGAVASLLMAISAVLAGSILSAFPEPTSYAILFLITGSCMIFSWLFLVWTKEPEHTPTDTTKSDWRLFYRRLMLILQTDTNFRWFLLARMFASFAQMAITFYTLYTARQFNADEQTIGILTSVMLLARCGGNFLFGYLGDRFGHRRAFALGALFAALAGGLAIIAPDMSWVYVILILAGCSDASFRANFISFTADFGTLEERPYYIGLTNTIIAPAVLFAPLIGGTLADISGNFDLTFTIVALAGFVTTAILLFVVREPHAAETYTTPPLPNAIPQPIE